MEVKTYTEACLQLLVFPLSEITCMRFKFSSVLFCAFLNFYKMHLFTKFSNNKKYIFLPKA